jgi:hypothetical protein
VTSRMSEQIRSDSTIVRRFGQPWREIVILERLARGGGAAKWYFVRSQDELVHVLDLFRGGSCVSFYFANQLRVEADVDSARQRMFDEITSAGELVIGYPSEGETELSMQIISGPAELSDSLMFHPEGSIVVWGQWPGRDNDGDDGITLNLVDEDGLLRPHPH